ncbi:N2,N2-dimethylguanosine tRNA methyltransferase isoform 2 [Hibiscus syriacus]|uniref:N2,N2-dimethylguanosine tRNA methyltransferase isoform 2 n=1 Tax=Hibiscus syriacus TaxID=106335 RepID=A0A6A2YSB7_HIBSY|nr:N2,N2-dimethylguanosine tRNA methyltransferase isoform 2 [Hibiscus syriacus]
MGLYSSLEAYGAYVRPMPYASELGLRILIGGAVREASVLGYRVTPLFSYYSCHGPVFRALLQMNRGKLPEKRDYGFICYCNRCGNSQAFSMGAGTGLEKLLKRMLEESDPRLPFGYIKLDEVASRAKTDTPSISSIMSALHKEGYTASRSHIASSAIKTDCPMGGCIRIAQKLHGC